MNVVEIMKFYVVFKGRKPRVYTTWMECDHEVSGYPGNLHSSYATRREAEEAYAHFKKLELGNHGQQGPAAEPIVKEDKKGNQGLQFYVKDIVLCCLIVVVLMQAYYLYK